MADYKVTEGIESTYRYHLSEPGMYVGLCGKRVMNTGIPVAQCGTKSHLNEKWCAECASRGAILDRNTKWTP